MIGTNSQIGNYLIKSNDFRNGAGTSNGLSSTMGVQHTPMMLRSAVAVNEEGDYAHT